MYKKILALCLSVALAMSTTIMPIFADSPFKGGNGDKNKNAASKAYKDIQKLFKDSEDIDWAEKSIEKMGAMGILNGVGNGLFKPGNNVTHAEAIAMVLKLKGEREKAEAISIQPEYFKGKSDRWSWGYLQLALDEGIIIPSEDQWFNPTTPAKRHEIAKYLIRALGMRDEALKNMNATLGFKDSKDVPKTSVGYVYLINKLGIMQGSKNEFQPNKPVTRAEMAVLLDRAEDKFDDTIENDNAFEGTFVSYDKTNHRITLEINDKNVTYTVNPYAPVYRNNTYYLLETLEPGDIIEIVLNSNNIIIFIEFKEEGTTTPAGQKLSIQHIQYSSLTDELKDKVDELKEDENYAAFKDGNYIYLVASMGEQPTSGYSIRVNDVYKQSLQTGTYNINAVIETAEPSTTSVTHSVTYPVDVVRFTYFEGIDKVKFVDTENTLIEETTVSDLDENDVISGVIDSLNDSRRIVYVEESDNDITPYYIPTSVKIYVNDRLSTFAALEENMTVEITRTNGEITRLDAEDNNVSDIISGIINSLDDAHRKVYVDETDGIVRAYYIPTSVKIYVNNTLSTFAALEENMNVEITKTNGTITRLDAEDNDNITVINGRITAVDVLDRTVALVGNDNVERQYTIPRTAQITLNNRTVTISSLDEGMTAAITKTNGVITKLAASSSTNEVDVINGKITSIDTINKLVTIKESDNTERTYYIPTTVQITLNGRRVALTSLTVNMTVELTRTNGVITALTATQSTQTINGKIDSVDETNSKLKVLENNNVVNSYDIPEDAQILVANQAADLADLVKGMSVVITKVDGVVTKVAAQNDTQSIQAVLINVYPSQNTTTINVKIGTTYKTYVVIPETAVFYNSQSIAIHQMPLNTPITIKLVNGIVTEIRNR